MKKSLTAAVSGVNHPSSEIPLRQWMLRITAFADRLEKRFGPTTIGLMESKSCSRDWIGRSEGAEVDFFIGPKADYQAWRADASALRLFLVKRVMMYCGFIRRVPTPSLGPRIWSLRRNIRQCRD
jgi:hypothetical protein